MKIKQKKYYILCYLRSASYCLSCPCSYGPYDAPPEDAVVVCVLVEAANQWEWWAPYASNIIMQGIFANQTYDEAIDLIKKNSRHYAKRQYTFFNNQMDVKWFETNYKNFSKTIEEVYNYIKD